MKVHVGVGRQPLPHLRRGVRGEVVQHHVDVLALVRGLRLGEEVRAVAGRPALAVDLAGGHVQGGEQVRGRT
jgi:hypothetical protein